MTTLIIKKSLDEWLDNVDYSYLNNGSYVPSQFALVFMNFIKLVNGKQGEANKTPPVHLAMLDKMISPKNRIANLCFRGAAKTTLFFEYLSLFLGVFGYLPDFGDVPGMIYVSDSMDNGVKSARKNTEFRYNNSEFLQEYIPEAHFTDNYLEFISKDSHRLGIKMFGAKTGLRGTKIFGKRPVLCVLDDLISDDDAKSRVSMQAIKDTVYKGVDYALDPTRRKIIFNGTPFNSEDIMIEAVESGAWDVNVWPVCERFPCTEEEFKGAWEDRFTYAFIKDQYDTAVLTGKLAGFYQELMLRISSEDERLVQDSEIRWYKRQQLLERRSAFNFYITTDFATKDTENADFSVISVWAYNANGDWFWVDGVCERQTMDKSINDLFRLVQEYKPMSVGIEVTGQQGAFIQWLQQEMLNRNIWFNFASSEKSGTPGIRPTVNKLSRFNLVVPWFKMGKMYFPEELKLSVIMGHFMGQIKLATVNGLKGKDDCIDTISQLAYLKAWKPSEQLGSVQTELNRWDEDEEDLSNQHGLSSYIV
ncbi:terminase large subunit protein [Rhizobium phage RHph_X2_28B]|uniref:terminase large subunit protein n=1 Tax=Rhizobium phage RHph_X2_28B TaxID=2836086 RepID=UPI00232976A4|nr:terminase large subunit protein [Rhizobium phage RHph_X2_28B]QWY83540.1 terminase large subunit protein [Rhizobium phage RHph_X2_28B]QWY83776.1 terminase large subunit protein [Rhizobium phage RHph_X3_15]